jgi:hypothetical protein
MALARPITRWETQTRECILRCFTESDPVSYGEFCFFRDKSPNSALSRPAREKAPVEGRYSPGIVFPPP